MSLHAFIYMFCLYNIQTPVKKPGDGRKVTFFEPGSVEEVPVGKCQKIGLYLAVVVSLHVIFTFY